MAADKLNKSSKVSNGICHTSWEIQKVKKKKHRRYDLNTKSRICLEWDDKKERVVPKKEQISIAQRELTPFLPFVAHYQNVLGDVFAAPPELFELNNLTGLLSYEVWQTQLSVQEREFLTQFLPEGSEPHVVVHELLAGNNLYFGNPFKNWGASICSGDYHPDAILRQEQRNKANKVAYYSELQEYHTKMIGSLQLWKERWTICTNPDNFMQKVPRPKRDFHKSGPSHETGLQNGPQHDLCVTSGSCSWDADDKSCNNNSPDLSATNGEALASVSRTDLEKRPKKGDKLRKLNIECGDGAKYMSYIKVSKGQHERVKSSMKQSKSSIQPRSLNLVLGNLDGFCVQPYELFEEEERQKLHDHWLDLAKKDLPAGFENWKSWRSAKWQLTVSLRKEMEDKWKSKSKSNDESVLNLYDNQDDESIVDGQDEEIEQSSKEQHDGEETNDAILITLEENVEQNDISVFRSDADRKAENHDTTNKSSQDSGQHQNFSPIPINTNDDVITESDAFPCSLVDYPESINHADTSVGEQFPPLSAATEIWPLAPLPNVYYHQPTSVSQDYPSVSQSSFLNRRSDSGDSFFNPYASQDRNELLLHSHYSGTSQFSRNLSLPLPLDPRLNIQQNVYADGAGRFPIPREEHEHLSPLDHVQGWPGTGIVNLPMSAPSHHRLSQNWFSDDEVARDGWSGGVVPNHDIGSGGQVVDESLYSVLSECNGLRYIQSENYAEAGRESVASRVGRGSGFNYMSGNEGQLGWIGLQESGGKQPFAARLWNDRSLG
ncbi:putative nuclear factor related to kappa-B-binding protein [Helianthus annuus]|nr:putative nuclear factor related to kappa-B-binding protein [Helianthus annuus]